MSNEDRAVRDIVRAVVVSHAGHELRYFTRLARFDDSWVMWRLHHWRGRDEPLGFGVDEMAALTSPVVWITLNEAAREFGSAAGDGMFAGVGALFRKLLRRKPKPATIPPLTEEQRQKVRDTVAEALRKRKFSDRRIEEIANAVYYELQAKSNPPGGTETGSAPVKE